MNCKVVLQFIFEFIFAPIICALFTNVILGKIFMLFPSLGVSGQDLLTGQAIYICSVSAVIANFLTWLIIKIFNEEDRDANA